MLCHQFFISMIVSCLLDTLRSTGIRKKSDGFTLIEMVIVILVLTILLAIAVPQVMRARATARAKTCIANLWEIQGAEVRWSFENAKTSTNVPNQDDLCPEYMKRWPECPEGGEYTVQSGERAPLCSIGDAHKID